jgi:hypothetical protein
VASGQAPNDPMNEFVKTLARMFPQYMFVLTNDRENGGEERILMDNVIYADEIIGEKKQFDLNQISRISTYCDLIIGKSSGPYSFSVTKDTIRKKRFLCFCTSIKDTWFLPDSKNILWSNDFSNMLPITMKVISSL